MLEEIGVGKSLDEVKSNTELTKKYGALYGTGFIKPDWMKEIFYTSLKGK